MFGTIIAVSKKGRLLLAASLMMALGAIIGATPVFAVSASVSPYYQQICPGFAATWTLRWGGYSPYTIEVDAAGGQPSHYYKVTTNTSMRFSSYYYDEGSYDVTLDVLDAVGDSADSTGHVDVYYGVGCPQAPQP